MSIIIREEVEILIRLYADKIAANRKASSETHRCLMALCDAKKLEQEACHAEVEALDKLQCALGKDNVG